MYRGLPSSGGMALRVFIVGSLPDSGPEEAGGRPDAFKISCEELGVFLASEGVQFVIGEPESDSAEYHVIEGARKYVNQQGKPDRVLSVTVVSKPDDKYDALPGGTLAAWLPEPTFRLSIISAANAQQRRVSCIERSDVAILMGGRRGTLSTGTTCFSLKHPALALPQFGGSSAAMWETFLSYYARRSLGQDHLEEIRSPWRPESAGAIYRALVNLKQRNPFIEHIELRQFALSIALPILITLWALIFVNANKIGPAGAFFAIVGIATTVGSVTKNVSTCYFEQEVRFSFSMFLSELVLGFAAVFAIFLLVVVGDQVIEGNPLNLAISDPAVAQRAGAAMRLASLFFAAFEPVVVPDALVSPSLLLRTVACGPAHAVRTNRTALLAARLTGRIQAPRRLTY